VARVPRTAENGDRRRGKDATLPCVLGRCHVRRVERADQVDHGRDERRLHARGERVDDEGDALSPR
jgi:hypothetical protein